MPLLIHVEYKPGNKPPSWRRIFFWIVVLVAILVGLGIVTWNGVLPFR